MDILNPVYTEKAECQDCYKCLRECPVKAIRIQQNHAHIEYENCVLCGHCVEVCPVGAKKVRNDLGLVKQILASGKKIVASLAPSYVSEFPELEPGRMVAMLKALGFDEVSETALGAEEVSAHTAKMLVRSDRQLQISSACPTVVQYIRKYQPRFAENIVPLFSPMLAHARILRDHYGEDIYVVFIGPCIAKKSESDQHYELINAAITFENLRDWFASESIHSRSVETSAEFQPRCAEEGALYPIDGGMIRGLKRECDVVDTELMVFSGMDNIRNALEEFQADPPGHKVFVEMLACEGGCVNGPRANSRKGTIRKRSRIIDRAEFRIENIPRKPAFNITEDFSIKPVPVPQFDPEDVRRALESVGKIRPEDELNCGSCGYNSCRDFAIALLAGKAEKTMCASYMRKLAQKKANALMQSMPSGVVIADREMRVIECNRNFSLLFSEDLKLQYEAKPGLENAALVKILPEHYKLFQQVLDSGEHIIEQDVKIDGKILHFTVFSIEHHQVVGAVVQDVTRPNVQREQIISKSKQVIEKSLSTVQRIAFLLGENAAENEILLNSIIDSFAPEIESGREED